MKRRSFLKGLCAVSAVTATMTPSLLSAEEKKKIQSPNAMDYKTAVDTITGGKGATESPKVSLTVPEIAENGAVVPVKVDVDHPMEENNYVKAIHVLAKENSNSRTADVMLTPLNGKGFFATRVKLAKTQEVVALVELSDGSFISAAKSVKVTIGGCG
ncbi:thiosulfate oxidation carrier protein SoxY [Sulfurovum sp. zt1-1]|uniref:Thiosulfate oxidation carrier protein SoxY n=1 Tax=Sulfurovum zhangzhouensis TaxID=3019067 RepID=A0ABT7R0W2_9BACT|nr:thiosulfate oxidation carrier protein SoxY [Sulfurovum zhangzhouensis]MDM5272735.1 thiosulfate oxidation carrier protein SoxY [Sulfurovum zhangzhouensis]